MMCFEKPENVCVFEGENEMSIVLCVHHVGVDAKLNVWQTLNKNEICITTATKGDSDGEALWSIIIGFESATRL